MPARLETRRTSVPSLDRFGRRGIRRAVGADAEIQLAGGDARRLQEHILDLDVQGVGTWRHLGRDLELPLQKEIVAEAATANQPGRPCLQVHALLLAVPDLQAAAQARIVE